MASSTLPSRPTPSLRRLRARMHACSLPPPRRGVPVRHNIPAATLESTHTCARGCLDPAAASRALDEAPCATPSPPKRSAQRHGRHPEASSMACRMVSGALHVEGLDGAEQSTPHLRRAPSPTRPLPRHRQRGSLTPRESARPGLGHPSGGVITWLARLPARRLAGLLTGLLTSTEWALLCADGGQWSHPPARCLRSLLQPDVKRSAGVHNLQKPLCAMSAFCQAHPTHTHNPTVPPPRRKAHKLGRVARPTADVHQ